VVFSDLKIAINSLAVLTLFFKDLSTVKNLSTRLGLSTSCSSSGVVIVNLVNKVRSVFLCNSKSFTKHLGFLIHGNGLLWLFSSQIALLGL